MTQGAEGRRQFWAGYQPGFRVSEAPVGSAEFFDDVERQRYILEPDIVEMAGFSTWADRDVLEAGCGIATDGKRFAHAGARYTAVDFSATALDLARSRFASDGLPGEFVQGSIVELPFADASFDLVYSMGVIHHAPETDMIVREFHRVLRPGGRAIVMVYHRSSFNYYVSIMALRRALVVLLLAPGGTQLVRSATHEPADVLRGHRDLLREHGPAYLHDRQLFLNHNTDGPGNPLSKVYTRAEIEQLFGAFSDVRTAVRFLHLRSYPGGARLARTDLARRLGRRWGWHLWIHARK